MRRRSPGATRIAEEQKKLLAVFSLYDPQKIISVLEELILPERRDKLLRTIEARLGSVTIVMDTPHDPHNGAAVMRSCDAFGIHEMHVVERRDTFLAAKTVARGSERWVDVHAYPTVDAAVSRLREDGFELVSTHPNGTLVPGDLASLPRFALVLGNERDGICEALANACDKSVRIPMRGFAESLNVSVTAAILLEHATRERPGDLSPDERAELYARALVLSVGRAAEVLAARGVGPEPKRAQELSAVAGEGRAAGSKPERRRAAVTEEGRAAGDEPERRQAAVTEEGRAAGDEPER